MFIMEVVNNVPSMVHNYDFQLYYPFYLKHLFINVLLQFFQSDTVSVFLLFNSSSEYTM